MTTSASAATASSNALVAVWPGATSSTYSTVEPGNAAAIASPPFLWAVFQPPSSAEPSRIITTFRSLKSPVAAALLSAALVSAIARGGGRRLGRRRSARLDAAVVGSGLGACRRLRRRRRRRQRPRSGPRRRAARRAGCARGTDRRARCAPVRDVGGHGCSVSKDRVGRDGWTGDGSGGGGGSGDVGLAVDERVVEARREVLAGEDRLVPSGSLVADTHDGRHVTSVCHCGFTNTGTE